ncbi:MAG: collagen-like protein, partial [Gaiellaceae bacterium]
MKQHLITAVVSALAATAIAGGVAYATIPDATGVIHGCYRTDLTDQKGQLRVVDDPANCRSNETATQWNQQGVPGAPGSQGPKGDKGDKGAAGVDGTDGTDGTNGTNGRDGSSVTSSVE